MTSDWGGTKREPGMVRGNGCRPHPVGGKNADELGLCDFSVNVLKWCHGQFQDSYVGLSGLGPSVVLPGGAMLEVEPGFDEPTLRRVLRAASRCWCPRGRPGRAASAADGHAGVQIVDSQAYITILIQGMNPLHGS